MRIYAWARYVFWADVEGQQYDAHDAPADESPLGLGTVLMLHSYASLWVAVEAWRACELSDDTVDDLLEHAAFQKNISLLRRLRNGVYHFQADLLSEKLVDFLREGERAVVWAFVLREEFKRVAWELANPSGVTPALREEFAEAFEGIVGWLPRDLAEAAPAKATLRHREILNMLSEAGDRSSEAGRDLLEAADQYRAAAHAASAGWSDQKRAMIEALKRQHALLEEAT